jgi:hypothetical protein
MRLTIIPIEGTVNKDGLSYLELDLSTCNIPADIHALQWQDVAGWIEYNSPSIQNEPITELPAWTNCCLAKWDVANTPVPPEPPTAIYNKETAVSLLQDTDWATIPDVADPLKSNPYLGNAEEFVVYRNQIRQYAIYPVAGYIDWPVAPQEVWLQA